MHTVMTIIIIITIVMAQFMNYELKFNLYLNNI